MEAMLVDALPAEPGWQFEPKWDGFRCLVFRTGPDVVLMSKSGKPLTRYFPEIEALAGSLDEQRYVIDGELIIPIGGVLSFDTLQARLHPAASRIARLSVETPAQLMLFDCLEVGDEVLVDRPLRERRRALEKLIGANRDPALLLSPTSSDYDTASKWLGDAGGALDGVVAKRLDQAYQPGERAMLKVKQHRTADCVVGGYRYQSGSKLVGSLLLGLYDADGKLDHVGFTAAIAAEDRPNLTKRLEALRGGAGFDGKAPGGPSRWSDKKSSAWEPVRPELVAEVVYDQVTGQRFRHGTRLLRWRPDKAPEQCRMDQLHREVRPSELAEIIA